MLYFASDPSFQGLAVSDDGAAWRRALPEGVPGPYPQEGNLIFMGRYDGMRYPQIVWRTPAGWQMVYYFSQELGDPSAGLRSSVSSDGVNWEPIEAEFHFENPHSNQTPGLVTPFWVEGHLYVAYCLWIEGENACYLARLVDALAE
jgi:hypothetical protein